VRAYALVTALLLSLLVAIPAAADHFQKPYEKIVRWSGCHADLITKDDVSVGRSLYQRFPPAIGIGTLEGSITLMVLLHEISHCLQDQEGQDMYSDLRAVELDADRRSVQLACALGLDGPSLLHDLWVWAKKTFGYEGDKNHGTLAQRISQGENVHRCIPRQES
jgi:hypothetical protein